jgi:chaperonin cofactor prefoldin
MKLSSRQQLLNESEMTLKQIKKSLNESKTKLREFSDDDWLDPLYNMSAEKFDLTRNWKAIMDKSPIDLSPEEIQNQLKQFDSTIVKLQNKIEIYEEAKKQLSEMEGHASSMNQYSEKITPENIADFIGSILIDDRSYRREIFKVYNDVVKKRIGKDWDTPGYTQKELLLTSPDELIAKKSFPKGGKQVDFLYKRTNGGNIVEPALMDTVNALFNKHYPELNDMLYVVSPSSARGSKWIKKNYILRVKRSAMSASGKAWRGIFTKYAEWK